MYWFSLFQSKLVETKASRSGLESLTLAGIFLSLSAMSWLAANDFNIAREEGFDPLRYEYYARFGLPISLSDSSSYALVFVLKFLYEFTPPYIGFVALVWVLLSTLLYCDRKKTVQAALISPIGFFYFSQTGKDGLAILAFAAVAIFVIRRSGFSFLVLLLVVSLSLFIRPALILFLPLVFSLFYFDLKKTVALSVLIATALFSVGIDHEALAALEGVASDSGSGSTAQLGRELTYGLSIEAVFGRAVLLFFSIFIQPIGSIVKFLYSAELYIVLEGLCQFLFLLLLLQKRIVKKFMLNSVPFVVIVAAASPFYHFRYIAITYPVIYAFTLLYAKTPTLRTRPHGRCNARA